MKNELNFKPKAVTWAMVSKKYLFLELAIKCTDSIDLITRCLPVVVFRNILLTYDIYINIILESNSWMKSFVLIAGVLGCWGAGKTVLRAMSMCVYNCTKKKIL
uniref:Uncharacterized protein n=1 Tax=Glossina austeni TaxID=7395 RepID=A0A1A9V538_GLOAU